MATASPRPEVVLYSRPGCHLCAVAKQMLYALRRTIPFDLREVNIESDPELEKRFLLEIPVVEVAGEVVSTAPIDLDRVRQAVNGARMRAVRGGAPPLGGS